jgi:anti-anti-sigma factor
MTQATGPFEWEDIAGVMVVRFHTPFLRDEQTILNLFEPITDMVDQGRDKVLINFEGVESIASYAIGKLVALNNKLAQPRVLALCKLTPIVEEIIDIMGLRSRLRIYDTERDALDRLTA